MKNTLKIMIAIMMAMMGMVALGEDANFKGLVTYAENDFIVVVRDDKVSYGGRLVKLHDAEGRRSEGPGKFCVGDKIRVAGVWHGDGVNREILASGIVKRGFEDNLESAPFPKSADMRRGILHLYRVCIEGELQSVEEVRDGDEVLTYLGISYEHTIHSVRLHGELPKDRFAPGVRVAATGVVFNRFDADGTAVSTQLEVSRASDLVITAGNPMAAVRAAIVALMVFFAAATALLLVMWIRSRRDKLRFQAIAEERRRIAGELHDTVEQHFAGAKILIAGVQNMPGIPPEAQSLLAKAANVMANAKLEVRDAVLDLRDDSSAGETLATALRRLTEQVNSVGTARVRLRLGNESLPHSTGLRKDVVAITREAITNAVKHGKAKNIAIIADGATLLILNDGEPFDASKALGPETGHFGLSGMRERAVRSGLAMRFVQRKRWCGLELTMHHNE